MNARKVIADIAVLPGGHKIVTASWDKTAAIWVSSVHGTSLVNALSSIRSSKLSAETPVIGRPQDIVTGERIAVMPHEAAVLGLATLVDGSVVTACGDGKLRKFGPTGELAKTLVGHRSPVRAVTVLRKGPEQVSEPLASVDNSGALLLWDSTASAGEELKLTIAAAHSSYLFCCDCNRTTGELLTAGDDSTVKIWAIDATDETWRVGLIQTIFVPGAVFDVAASPVTGDILAASTDGVGQLSSLTSSEWTTY